MGRPGVARRPSRGVLRAIILVLLALCISGALAYTARSVHDLAASCIDSDTCAPAGDPCKPHGTRVVLGSGQTCICRSGTVLASSFSGDPVCITAPGADPETDLRESVKKGGVVDLGGFAWVLTQPLEVDFPVTLRNGIIRVQSEAWLVEGSNVIHAPYVIQVARGRQLRLENVEVHGRGVYVENAELRMRDSRVGGTLFAAVYATAGATVSITGGSLEDASTGLWAEGGATVTLEGVEVAGSRDGIMAVGVQTRVTFRGGTLRDLTGHGVVALAGAHVDVAALAGAHVDVAGADIARVTGGAGVRAKGGSVSLRGSVVRESASHHVYCQEGCKMTLEDTSIVGQKNYYDYGVRVEGSGASVEMTGGSIADTYYGVDVNYDGSFTSTGVAIQGGTYGLYMQSGTFDAKGGSMEASSRHVYCASGPSGRVRLDGVHLDGSAGVSVSSYQYNNYDYEYKSCRLEVSGRTGEDLRGMSLECYGGASFTVAGQEYTCEEWQAAAGHT